VNSHSCPLYAVAHLSVVCLFVGNACAPYLGGSAVFLWHLVRWPSIDVHEKFDRDHPRGTPPLRELNTTGVAKYSDFGPIEGYILEIVQDRRQVSINQ